MATVPFRSNFRSPFRTEFSTYFRANFPYLPEGFVFLVDNEGRYLTDNENNFLIVKE